MIFSFGKIMMLSLMLSAVVFSQYHERCDTATNCFVPKGYDKRLRPTVTGESTRVNVSLWIESFGKIDVAKMEFEAYGYLIQQWNDPRLSNATGTPLTLEGNEVGILWTPDIYCVNCRSTSLKSGRNDKQSAIRLEENGDIYYSVGLQVTASCKMDLKTFPFDAQICQLQFSSYGYNLSSLHYSWRGLPVVTTKSLDQFDVTDAATDIVVQQYLSGKYPILHGYFTFKRRIGFYILQLYVPTIMLVCLSWTMFLLTQEHSGDRLTIGVTLFLTMILLHGYANTSLPKVSYIKEVDWFMIISLASILLIIVESLIATRWYVKLKNKEDKRKRQESVRRYNALKMKEMDCFNDNGIETDTLMTNGRASRQTQNSSNFNFKRPVVYKVSSPDHSKQFMEGNMSPRSRKRLVETALSYTESAGEEFKCLCHKVDDDDNNELKCGMESTQTARDRPRRECWKDRKTYQKIEYLSCILFPVTYISFLAWYWYSNTSRSKL